MTPRAQLVLLLCELQVQNSFSIDNFSQPSPTTTSKVSHCQCNQTTSTQTTLNTPLIRASPRSFWTVDDDGTDEGTECNLSRTLLKLPLNESQRGCRVGCVCAANAGEVRVSWTCPVGVSLFAPLLLPLLVVGSLRSLGQRSLDILADAAHRCTASTNFASCTALVLFTIPPPRCGRR